MEDAGGRVAAAQLSEAEERRQEERYSMLSDAEIFIPERTAMFRGQVVNISSSGCYVRTVAWVRVPPTTVVELRFMLDGRVIRTRAEARFAQSRTGVGLRFVATEEEVGRRLEDAIAKLSATAGPEEAEADPEESAASDACLA